MPDSISATREAVAADLHHGVSTLLRRLRHHRPAGTLAATESQALNRIRLAGTATPGELARLEGISAQSMGAVVGALEQQGLVTRAKDPQDGRRVVLSVTPAGERAAQDKHAARVVQISAAMAEALSDDEVLVLQQAIPLLVRVGEALR